MTHRILRVRILVTACAVLAGCELKQPPTPQQAQFMRECIALGGFPAPTERSFGGEVVTALQCDRPDLDSHLSDTQEQ